MGPRLVSRGKNLSVSRRKPTLPLQWGRDLLVAERGLRIGRRVNSNGLQWGRDLLVAERLGRVNS